MQYADLMRPDEDWRGLGDPSERRKIQNRIAQRAYRRNMRERADQIEQLKKQLSAYEDVHLNNAHDEQHTYQQPNNPPILSPSKRGIGGWCPSPQGAPPPASHKERYHVPLPHDAEFSRVQQHGHSVPIEQQPSTSPRPASRQHMQCWPPANSQSAVTESLTLGPSLPLDGGLKTDGISPLSSTDLSTTSFEDFAFDAAELANKSRQSTPLLHMAIAGNHIDTVRVLLQDERVMVDDKDIDGYTPLQRAVMHGRSEIVKLLLEHNAHPGLVRGGDLPLGPVGGFGTNFPGS